MEFVVKKTAFMIVYNDADYVDYAIRSIKDWVDEFVVVEGAFEITMEAGSPARSNDGTLEILQKYVDSGDIILKQVNLREHKHHYDVGYQYAIENGSDWAILIDSDEVWVKKTQMMADAFMKKFLNEPAVEMRVDEYSFVNDFQTWYPGTYPRIFKCTPGSKFVFDNEVQFEGRNRGQHLVHHVPGRDIHHYGYVRRKKRWKLKQDYMWLKDFNPLNKKYTLKGDEYVLPEDIPIYKYTGHHPEIMKDHPFYGMTANQIIYGEEDEQA
jgi:glycosyltransferase involved in cell wall biosynthesis